MATITLGTRVSAPLYVHSATSTARVYGYVYRATEDGMLFVWGDDGMDYLYYESELTDADTIVSLAETHPTLHVGGVSHDHRAHTVTITFDAFMGNDDLPTSIATRTFSGLAATRLLMENFAGLNETFGLTPDFS